MLIASIIIFLIYIIYSTIKEIKKEEENITEQVCRNCLYKDYSPRAYPCIMCKEENMPYGDGYIYTKWVSRWPLPIDNYFKNLKNDEKSN